MIDYLKHYNLFLVKNNIATITGIFKPKISLDSCNYMIVFFVACFYIP